jgi:hypothetical protein
LRLDVQSLPRAMGEGGNVSALRAGRQPVRRWPRAAIPPPPQAQLRSTRIASAGTSIRETGKQPIQNSWIWRVPCELLAGHSPGLAASRSWGWLPNGGDPLREKVLALYNWPFAGVPDAIVTYGFAIEIPNRQALQSLTSPT